MNKLKVIFLSLSVFVISCNENNEGKSNVGKVNDSLLEIVKNDSSAKIQDDTSQTKNSSASDFTYKQTEEKNTTSLKDIFKQLEKPSSVYTIPANKDTVLICAGKTILKIKANSFVNEKTGNPVTGTVSVLVNEYYTIEDILSANLSTSSNGKLLETGGMIYIAASSNGENCILKKGEKIDIGFASQIEKEKLQLFSGGWNKNEINWQLVPNSFPTKNATEEEIYTEADRMPAFPGGETKLKQFFKRNIEYPKEDVETGMQGTVVMNLVVMKDGSLNDIKIIKGVSPYINVEALRVIKKSPNWLPGKIRGKPVNVKQAVSIPFFLGEERAMVDSSFGEGNTNDKAYKEKFEKIFKDKPVDDATVTDVSKYLFSTSQLGWINCDRFSEERKSRLVQYNVLLADAKEATIKIVFHKMASIMSGEQKGNVYNFTGVPSGKKITIVALKYHNSKRYLAIKETETSKMAEKGLVFEPVTMAKLKEEIQKLNSIKKL